VGLPESVRALAKSNQALWVLDHTFSSWSTVALPDRTVSIRDLSLQAGIPSLPVAVMTGESDCIEGCWRVHPTCAVAAPAMALTMSLLDNTASIDTQLQEATACHIELGERLANRDGFQVSEPAGPALMVHSLAESPGDLARRLGDGVSAAWSSDHTWHGRLRLHVKSMESVDQILETLRNN
jgi:histidinol-phosphate/aromatic aminotransferase/cobyric acid decarboxylase-like protein